MIFIYRLFFNMIIIVKSFNNLGEFLGLVRCGFFITKGLFGNSVEK